MAIYVGTNKGGNIADLADNLNLENSTADLSSSGFDAYVDQEAEVLVGHGELFGISTTVALAEDWNTAGYKEIKLEDTSDESILISNFVDVHIDNQSENDSSMLNIYNVKRANINTGSDSDDIVNITVRTNGGSEAVNNIVINTGSGEDFISMSSEFAKATHTTFDIDAGEGDDLVDISGLVNAKGAWIDRYASGGEGLDVLVFNNDKALEFDGFEVLQSGQLGSALTLDGEDVVANASSDGILVVSGFDIDFDFTTVNAGPLGEPDINYLDSLGFDSTDFEVVTANIDGADFTLLVDNVELV